MAVRTRGGKHQADFFIGSKRIRKNFDTYAAAAKFELEETSRYNLGIPTTDSSPLAVLGRPRTLRELFDWCEEHDWKDQKALRSQVSNAKVICKLLGDSLPWDTIKNGHFRLLSIKYREWKPGTRGGTINRKMACLHAALEVAKSMEWCTAVPSYKKEKEPPGRVRFLSQEEEVAVIAYCERMAMPEYRDSFIVLIDTGLRREEFVNLTRDDLDLPGNLVIVNRSKNDCRRSIELTERVRAILSRRALAIPHGKLFNVSCDSLTHQFAKVRDGLGIEDEEFVLHCLRHTFASRLVQAGEDLYTVSKLMGHKDVKVTQRYAHLAPKNLRRAIQAMEAANRRIPGGIQVVGNTVTVTECVTVCQTNATPTLVFNLRR